MGIRLAARKGSRENCAHSFECPAPALRRVSVASAARVFGAGVARALLIEKFRVSLAFFCSLGVNGFSETWLLLPRRDGFSYGVERTT